LRAQPLAISVIVPTKGRPDKLARSLEAIMTAGRRVGRPFEVVVLDDGNDSATEAVVRAAAAEGEALIYVPASSYGGRGQGDARNAGARLARANLLAFTDDDTECAADWLARAVGRLEAEPGLAGVEGAVVPKPSGRVDPVRIRVVENTRGRAFLTANIVLRRSAFLRAGGVRRLRTDGHPRWDHSFREDTDLALRVEEHAGPIPFDAELRVHHPFEHPSLSRYLRTATFFEVDEAFRMIHPAGIPRLVEAPLARARVRAGCVLAGLLPLTLNRRTQVGVAALAFLAGVVLNVQVERDLRNAGVRRGPGETLVASARRTPRCIAWALVAGLARLVGIVEARGGLVPVRRDYDLPVTMSSSDA
jgi:hypothetical protein